MDSRAKDIMTVPELCEYLQLSEAKVREMLRQGTIPAVLIGRQWRIRRSAIDAWLAEQEQAAKVIQQRGGQQRAIPARGDRLGRARAHAAEPLPPPKPPRQPRTSEVADPGARTPPPASAPAGASPAARREMAQRAVKRAREERRAGGRP